MEKQERSPSWLAHKIHCQRSNIYYIYSQPSINTDLLMKISQALKIDLFKLYSSIYDDVNNFD